MDLMAALAVVALVSAMADLGGGNGGQGAGGGGFGAGGDIFVQQGGLLTIESGTLSGGSVVGGAGGTGDPAPGGNGSAFGAGIFAQGSGTLTFAPAATQVETISDIIADQTGSGGSGSWGLLLNGAGTVALAAAETYSGGTTVDAGVLELVSGGSLTSTGNLIVNGGTFNLNGLNQTVGDLSGTGGTITLGTNDLTAGTGNTTTFAGVISGSGLFFKAGAGTQILTGASTYTGGTIIEGGTLQLGNGGAGGAILGVVVDDGVLAIKRSDIYTFAGPVGGNGAFEQLGPGTTILTGTDNVAGGSTISAGTLELGNGGSITGNVTFSGMGATLRLDTGTNQLGGSILGMMVGDSLDLRFQAFAVGNHAIWQQISANAGTLSLVNSSGASLAAFNLSDAYNGSNFSVAEDGSGGTSIELVNPVQPAGTTADMILNNPSNGDYEIYDVGGNAILAAYLLTQVGAPWRFAGLGMFQAGDTSDMLLRNSSTGAFEAYYISNNNVTNVATIGTVGTNWNFAGIGDFDGGSNLSELLLRNSSSGAFELYQVASGGVLSGSSVAAVGNNFQVEGFGHFSGSRHDSDGDAGYLGGCQQRPARTLHLPTQYGVVFRHRCRQGRQKSDDRGHGRSSRQRHHADGDAAEQRELLAVQLPTVDQFAQRQTGGCDRQQLSCGRLWSARRCRPRRNADARCGRRL